MSEKKFVSLSESSLKKVYDWCERNEGDPLAKAYFGACTALGSLETREIAERLGFSRLDRKADSRKVVYWDTAYRIKQLAFKYRDTIGREILKMLKREERMGVGE